MKTTRAIIQQLQDEVSALKLELAEAKTQLEQERVEAKSTAVEVESYASVASASGPRNHHRDAYVGRQNSNRQRDQRSLNRQRGQHVPKKASESHGNVKVVGARKVWGTVKASSSNTILSTIAKFIPSVNTLGLRVRRKTKENGPKLVWWFVIHGPEKDLTLLDKDWEKIQVHTSWVIKPCFMAGSPQNTNPTQQNNIPNVHVGDDSTPSVTANSTSVNNSANTSIFPHTNADPQNPPSTNTTSSPLCLSPKPNSQVEQNIAISKESLTGSNAAEDSNEHLVENQPPPVRSQ